MWHRLKVMPRNEPTAIGTLVASIAPALVLLGVLKVDEMGLSALVVAVNALMGFAVRLLVAPMGNTEEAVPAAEIRPAGGAPA
jgi:hypothetical protein